MVIIKLCNEKKDVVLVFWVWPIITFKATLDQGQFRNIGPYLPIKAGFLFVLRYFLEPSAFFS